MALVDLRSTWMAVIAIRGRNTQLCSHHYDLCAWGALLDAVSTPVPH